jgi:hypothetical protein
MAVIASIISKFDERGVREAETATTGLGGKLGNFGKIAGAAFAGAAVAAGAFAIKLGVEGVKAAIEDEAAQKRLATTLKNVTGAQDDQVKAVEDYILKTELAYGVTDDKLRPSLDRLVRSTKNVEEAQKLQALALDISAGTGKDLQAVSEALAKAHDGNFTALKKLGVSMDDSIIKSKNFDAATAALSRTFAGQATVQAGTFEGKMARLNIAFSEAKETVGGYIIDALTPLLDLTTKNVIPVLAELSDKIGKELAPVFADLGNLFNDVIIPLFKVWWGYITEILIPALVGVFKPALSGLFSAFSQIAETISDNREKLEPLFNLFKTIGKFVAENLAPIIGTILGGAFKLLGTIISGIIEGLSTFIGWITTAINKINELARTIANSPLGKIAGAVGGVLGSVFGGGRASGGYVAAGTSYLVGEQGAEIFTPSRSGYIIPNGGVGGGTQININVSGALDPVSVARQISTILERQNVRLGIA